jgi:hypothetical protein
MDISRQKGTIVYSRDGKIKGRLTGAAKRCSIESCTGERLGTRWDDDNKITWPCTDGMVWRKRSWRLK